MRLHKSLKARILLALGLQMALLVSVVSLTLYELKQRQHDYIILNLAGQLRVISQVMVSQSLRYTEKAPRDYFTYTRDLGLYHKDLREQIASFDTIIDAFRDRNLAPVLLTNLRDTSEALPISKPVPSLLAGSELITCTWDKPSRSQLDATATVWHEFRDGLLHELGNPAAPRLEAAANYILLHQDKLLQSSADLSIAFRLMMENKLNDIRRLNQASLWLSLLIGITLLVLLYRKIFRPVGATVKGFERVAQGDLHYRVPVNDDNEIGHMSAMFNQLTQRLAAIFHLTDRINQATTLDDSLRFVAESFSELLPIDCVMLLRSGLNSQHVQVERIYAGNGVLHEGDMFPLEQSLFHAVQVSGRAKQLPRLGSNDGYSPHDPLLQRFAADGVNSLIYLPLHVRSPDHLVLVFAAKHADAYLSEHLELLGNIAAQVSHGVEKTIGMESLVISAVEGLAKLAESRDPETGDHLYRMSRYSAILTEELGRTHPQYSFITPQYVRNILRFAPMHDIGKVGIADHILLKPGRLDEAERTTMQQHPLIGAEVLRRCEEQVNAAGHSIFQIGIEIAEGHHERYDGKGYPHGLRGEAIPLSARIVALADVFDALTSRRPYKEPWPVEEALRHIDTEAGGHFDPHLVQALHSALPRILEIYERHKHL